jgi:hypothetical protein
MRKTLLPILVCFLFFSDIKAQMDINGSTMYGHEWIDYSKRYFKIKLAEDGIYQLDYNQLIAAGVPLNELQGAQIQLYYMGSEIPIKTSTEQQFGITDYIEFYGQKNRGELDRHIYQDPDSRQLNPEYSLFSDSSSYFLTWDTSLNNVRMNELSNDLSGNLPPVEEFYMHEEKQVFTSFHHKPTHNGTDRVRYSSFDFAEGYGSALEVENKVDFSTSHVFLNGTSPRINIRFGANSGGHVFEVYLDSEFQSTEGWFGYGILDKTYNFSTDKLKENMSFEIIGTSNNDSKKDKNTIAFANLIYPREYKFGGNSSFTFSIGNSVFQRYFEIDEFDLEGGAVSLYDISNGNMLDPVISDSKVKFVLAPSNTKRDLLLINRSKAIKSEVTIQEIEFKDYTNLDPSYIILSSARLNSSENGTNYVQAYADYRGSADGGAFNTTIVEVEELYNQFGYGIDRHSISIRNFMHYITQYWSNAEYLFIIGKAMEYQLFRTQDQFNEENINRFHVPTFGNPGGDILLASENGEVYPLLPLGRYAAQSPDDVRLYLDKVIEHESPLSDEQTIEDQLWKKKVIHLSGGDATIQGIIKSFLGEMEDVIENNSFGAEVTTFQKKTSDPIQTSISQQIIDNINNGVSILTFFGHSAVGTFDFSLEDPGKYENQGRYPLIVSLGCHSGNIHTNALGISENFVIEEGRAAIAFLASSSSAYISPQRDSGKDLYDFLGGDLYSHSLGKVIRNTIDKRKDNLAISVRTLMEQLTFHGDPALKLSPSEGPDYVVDYASIQTVPKIVSTNQSTFTLDFDVINLGMNVKDSIVVEVLHQLPDGSYADTINLKIESPVFRSSISVELPIPGIDSRGKNTIYITADVKNNVEELPKPAAEGNNETIDQNGEKGFCFFILDNSARPVFPSEFSIVNDKNIKLLASTSNAFIESQKYILEIDTTELYNSPLYAREEIVQGGGLIEWNPGLDFDANTVYYWRISPDSTNTTLGYIWNGSSFIYIPESSPGWNQSHHFQYLRDDFNNIFISEERDMEFANTINEVRVQNGVFPSTTPTIVIENVPHDLFNFGAWPKSGVTIAAFDPVSGESVLNAYPGSHGSVVPGNWATDWRTFPFWTRTQEERESVINFLENIVPEGYVVIIYTLQTDQLQYDPVAWAEDENTLGKSIFSVLEAQGATRIREILDSGPVPYIFSYRKNNTSYAVTEIMGDLESQISTNINILGRWENGNINSTLIGPASSWDKIVWNLDQLESTDEATLTVYAYDNLQNEFEIITNSQETEIDISDLNDANYPFIKLVFAAEDLKNRTAPNINFWRVFYEGLPEITYDPESFLDFYQDTIDQGEDFRFSVDIRNIKDYDMDSVLVNYLIQDINNNEILLGRREAPLAGKESLRLDFNINSSNFSGEYLLNVELNPDNDQPEEFHFNNIYLRKFFVREDKTNPILDVTFDGIHIMDGDIISSKPHILASLSDENMHLLIDNIESFELALEYPDGNIWNVPLDHSSLDFMPASGPDNVAKLSFSPELDQEGEYKLIIQAKDKSQNFSGSNAYEVNFRVILEQSISNVLNYPNPFSTSTQFVFTLTGSEVPEYFKIQIMTLSGKVVKEITKDELGAVHIGINRTDYKWTGTDDYGDRLANGVYLYRVISRNNEQEHIKRLSTSMDQLFKEGFGKLVIMR